MQDAERVERTAVAVMAAGDAQAGVEGEETKRAIKVVVVGGEGGEVEVLEDVVVGEPHRQVFRVEGTPGAEGERVRLFHAGPEGAGFFAPLAGRGFLGVHLVDLTPELRAHFGAAGDAGLLVGRVEPGSPAEQAGVRVGDLLTHVGGEPVTSSWDVLRRVRPLGAGEGVALEVVRDGRVETLSATVAEREQPQIDAHALLRRLGEDGEVKVWQIDPEEMGRRMGEVTEFFASPEWRERVKSLTVTGEGLEERLEAMERELERLEKQIQEQNRELEEQNRQLP
jgi:membrane-associated protease RseP (regulator of RpoE activity)